MSRILLADDSPHAQRMGERILREEGYEVVSVTDGMTALMRLGDVDPDLILADVFLPGKSGLEICRFVKNNPIYKHVRIVATAGLLEPFDENEARGAGADAIIKKPFEASAVISTIKPLVEEAQAAREAPAPAGVVVEFPSPPRPEPVVEPEPAPHLVVSNGPVVVDDGPEEVMHAVASHRRESFTNITTAELVRASVTLALAAAMPTLIEEITDKVLLALNGTDEGHSS